MQDAYGGTYRLVARMAGPWGVTHATVDLADLDAVRDAVRTGETRAVWWRRRLGRRLRFQHALYLIISK